MKKVGDEITWMTVNGECSGRITAIQYVVKTRRGYVILNADESKNQKTM